MTAADDPPTWVDRCGASGTPGHTGSARATAVLVDLQAHDPAGIGAEGLAVLRLVRAELRRTRLIAVGDDVELVESAFRCGADAYLDVRADTEAVWQAITTWR